MLAGLTAIEAMGGPVVPWQPGRSDYNSAEEAEKHRGNVGDRSASLERGHLNDQLEQRRVFPAIC